MKNHDPFRHSELDRVKPKTHLFLSLLKRHKSDTGLVEDRTGSVTIIRIIGGLLMLHLIVIGGVLLRGHIVRTDGNINHRAAVNPAGTQTASRQTVLPPPPSVAVRDASHVPPIAPAAPAAAPHPTAPANHITAAEDTAEDVAVEADEPVTLTPGQPAAPVLHNTAPGDCWQTIARQYGVSIAALQAANPELSGVTTLAQGTTIVIPVGATGASVAAGTQPVHEETHAPRRAATSHPNVQVPATDPVQNTYTVRSGDSLSGIARRTKVPVRELIRLNNIKNADKIKPGMQLRLH